MADFFVSGFADGTFLGLAWLTLVLIDLGELCPATLVVGFFVVFAVDPRIALVFADFTAGLFFAGEGVFTPDFTLVVFVLVIAFWVGFTLGVAGRPLFGASVFAVLESFLLIKEACTGLAVVFAFLVEPALDVFARLALGVGDSFLVETALVIKAAWAALIVLVLRGSRLVF